MCCCRDSGIMSTEIYCNFYQKKFHMLWLWTRHKCHCVCNCNMKKSGIMHGFLDFHLLKDLIILTLLCWNISSPGLQLWKMVWKYKLIIFYTDSHIHMYKKFQKNAVKGRAPRTQELLLENAESLIKEVAKNVIPVYHLWKLIRTI